MRATSTRDRAYIVEIVGPPGVGKSTLASALADEYEFEVVPGYRSRHRVGVMARAIVASVPDWIRTGAECSSIRRWRWIARARASPAVLARVSGLGRTVVVDQGP